MQFTFTVLPIRCLERFVSSGHDLPPKIQPEYRNPHTVPTMGDPFVARALQMRHASQQDGHGGKAADDKNDELAVTPGICPSKYDCSSEQRQCQLVKKHAPSKYIS